MPVTQAENDFLTRVGPGQPAGVLLRRYWHPVAMAGELTEEQPTRFVRLLGENLVLFRDKAGRVGLLADQCAHRGASLCEGRVEERGISCAYHGWLFDTGGKILETPPERNDAVMKHVRQPAFPCRSSSECTGRTWGRCQRRRSLTTTCSCARTVGAALWCTRSSPATGCSVWRTQSIPPTSRSCTRRSSGGA